MKIICAVLLSLATLSACTFFTETSKTKIVYHKKTAVDCPPGTTASSAC